MKNMKLTITGLGMYVPEPSFSSIEKVPNGMHTQDSIAMQTTLYIRTRPA